MIIKMRAFFNKTVCIITFSIIAAVLCIVPVSAESAKLNKTSVNLSIGYVTTLKVSNADDVKWSSMDSSVAKIKSTDGNTAKISGKKTGNTYIYAKIGNKTLKCKVTVRKSFISANSKTVNLDKGEQKTVTYTISGSKSLAFSNSDKNVCSTSWSKWDGNKIKLTITAKNSGNAKIKVYAKGYSDSTAEIITINVNGSSNTEINDIDAGSEEIEKILEIVNKERTEAGENALTLDPILCGIAEKRAQEIIERFSHTRPDETSCFTAFSDAGIEPDFKAENIAAGQHSAESVMITWMNSLGHKQNILDSRATRMGASLIKTSDGYGYYWVQVFSDEF